jgi:hypothetical protein
MRGIDDGRCVYVWYVRGAKGGGSSAAAAAAAVGVVGSEAGAVAVGSWGGDAWGSSVWIAGVVA